MAWLLDAMTRLFKEEGNGFNRVRQAATAVREDIERASAGGAPMTVPFGLFMSSVESQLELTPGGGLPTNRVTLTGMAQLRPLPYRIIAIVGLNDDCSFPGTMRRHEFDLMAVAPRRGDRDSRIDNRNVFLDLLLAARDRFLVSYVCGTGEAAKERQPSIVAQELRDWLLDFTESREERNEVAERLTVTVPLNAFSQSNFEYGHRDWRSHDKGLFEAVKQAIATDYSESDPVFADKGLKANDRTTVTLRELADFWKKPATRTLGAAGVWLGPLDEGAQEGLMPGDKGLEQWVRRFEAYKAFEAGQTVEAWETCVKANPRYGALGVREWFADSDTAFGQKLYQYHQALAEGQAVDDIDIDLDLGADMPRLLARLKGVYVKEGVRRLVRISSSKSSSMVVLRDVLDFLVGCAAGVIHEAKLVCVWADNLKSLMKAPKEDPNKLVVVSLPSCDAEVAKAILRILLVPYLTLTQSPFMGTDNDGVNQNYTIDQRADQILWRGRDLKAAQSKTRERQKVFEQLLPKLAVGQGAQVYNEVLQTLKLQLDELMALEGRSLTLPKEFLTMLDETNATEASCEA